MKEVGFTRSDFDVYLAGTAYSNGLHDRIGFSFVTSREVPAVQAVIGVHWADVEVLVDEMLGGKPQRSAGTVIMDSGVVSRRGWQLFEMPAGAVAEGRVDAMVDSVLEAQGEVRDRLSGPEQVFAYLAEHAAPNPTRSAAVLPVAALQIGRVDEAVRTALHLLEAFETLGPEVPFTVAYRRFVGLLIERAAAG